MAPHVSLMEPGPFAFRHEAYEEANGVSGECLLIARANLNWASVILLGFGSCRQVGV